MDELLVALSLADVPAVGVVVEPAFLGVLGVVIVGFAAGSDEPWVDRCVGVDPAEADIPEPATDGGLIVASVDPTETLLVPDPAVGFPVDPAIEARVFDPASEGGVFDPDRGGFVIPLIKGIGVIVQNDDVPLIIGVLVEVDRDRSPNSNRADIVVPAVEEAFPKVLEVRNAFTGVEREAVAPVVGMFV